MKEKNTQGMKILCYFGIVICLVLIIVPPVLRAAIPREETVEKPKEKYVYLTCNTSDNGEIIRIDFYTEELIIGQIKYTFVEDAENFVASELKHDLEDNLGLEPYPAQSNDGPIRRQLLLVPEDNSSNVLSANQLSKITTRGNPEELKKHYEELNFTCKIEELKND